LTLTVPALDALVADLTEAFARGTPGQRIAALLGAYAREHDDWRALALWSDECYTRNEVARTDAFQLLVLCWGVGQESPIHNHEGQDCWMGVLEGGVEEVRYCRPQEVRPGPLAPRSAAQFEAGQVAYISDDIGLHVVRSAEPSQRAVSLHLYAAPYDHCNVYCPDTGEVSRKPLENFSCRGERL